MIIAALAGMQRLLIDPGTALSIAADLADGRADGPEALEAMEYVRKLAM